MRIVRKLTTIYIIGFIFLIIVILVAALSFNDIYTNIEKISELIETLIITKKSLSSPEFEKWNGLMEEVRTLRIRAYIFFTLAVLISLIGMLYIFYLYRKNIVEPLQRITSATQKMAQGQFEKLSVKSSIEIGRLAENFNSMGEILNERLKELEDSIQREQAVIRRLNILNELSGSIASKLKVDEVLETILSSSKTLVKSEVGAVVLIDRFSHHITHFTSSPVEKMGEIRNFAEDIINELINKKMSIRSNIPSKDKEFKDILENVKIKINNFLAVPILIEEQILGGIIFINKMGGEEFTMEDEDNALMVSFQAAMAIEKSFYHEEVENLARTDGLTGLNNHRTFHEQLDIELKRVRRFGGHLALLLIDIDFFKKFNDTYGHQGGDVALKELAGVLKRNLRGIDSAGRYGGEEFTVILPQTDLNGAIKTAERIKKEVSSHPIVINGAKAHLTVSIGISIFPDDAMDKEDLIKAADDALYMAKRTGRNKIVTFQQYKAETTK